MTARLSAYQSIVLKVEQTKTKPDECFGPICATVQPPEHNTTACVLIRPHHKPSKNARNPTKSGQIHDPNNPEVNSRGRQVRNQAKPPSSPPASITLDASAVCPSSAGAGDDCGRLPAAVPPFPFASPRSSAILPDSL